MRPINNVVDVTNYVLHGLGQPLHAFDADKIKEGKVIVRTLPTGTKFITLDGVERALTDRDLIICNPEEGMCIAGVFGGMDSGVTENTVDVFLESANFHPTWIRKTARRFGLNTDSSFRYERGLDPNATLEVFKYAAMLIKEVAGGDICGDIYDIYPNPVAPYPVNVTYNRIYSLIGKEIAPAIIRSILDSLEIKIEKETADGLSLLVPPYRYDVRRDVDVIEEILRVYGYNNVEISDNLRANLTEETPTDRSYKLQERISEQLCGEGFMEIWNNSLTKQSYYETSTVWPASQCVRIINALSNDLSVMRQTLLFGGLESISRNEKRKNGNLRLFEFGNCYLFNADKGSDDALAAYSEDFKLGLWMSGNYIENSWSCADEAANVFQLKASVENIFRRLGIAAINYVSFTDEAFSSGLEINTAGGKRLGTMGIVRKSMLKLADVDSDVFFAELSWKALMKEAKKNKVNFTPLSKFQPVRRDLALLLDKAVSFSSIEKVARESERKFLCDVELFDVYEGKNLPEGKKSYAVSFYLLNEEKPFTDVQIDGIMKKIQTNLETKLGAEQR
jgi:phenylalanyl-tRNA synthetase beta chain